MTDEEMPQPEAIWLALGIVVWAVATALAPTVRSRFIDALANLTEDGEMDRAVVTFSTTTTRTGDMPQSMRLVRSWFRRIIDELRAARG